MEFGYDSADQLRNASLTDTSTGTAINQYSYDYDPSGNRTNAQIGSTIIKSVPNNLNQLTSESAGGKMHFRGTLNEPATVTVGGNLATVDSAGNFDGVADVNVGTNTVAVVATDASGNTRTNNYQVTVPSGTSTTLLYDLNGNLASGDSKTYEWDAANRLIAINYQGTTDRTEFTYDGRGRRIKIVEKTNSVSTSTKNLVWIEQDIAEERDDNNVTTKRYYRQGFTINGQPSTSNYFYTRDHLDSIREAVNGNGIIQARYDYDPYGRRTKISGTLDVDFAFTNHYYHQRSGLQLSLYRAYDANLGRWISRDPKANSELLKDGPNLYAYVGNAPEDRVDHLGLQSDDPRPPGPTPDGPPAPYWGEPPCECPPRLPAAEQDNVCTPPAPQWLNANRCAKQCCKDHDDCYKKHSCHDDSWPWGEHAWCYPACITCNTIASVCVADSVPDPLCWIP